MGFGRGLRFDSPSFDGALTLSVWTTFAWFLYMLGAPDRCSWILAVVLWLGSVSLPFGLATAHRAREWRRLRELKDTLDVRGVAQMLGSSNGDVRREAAAVLGRSGDPRAPGFLLDSVRSEDRALDPFVVGALLALGPVSAAPLIQALGDARPPVRGTAAHVLGRLGDACAADPLVHAMDDPDPIVRTLAEWALDRLGPLAVPALTVALSDALPWVRTRAARVLGEIGDPGPLEPLVRALADPMLDVREEAALALGKLQDGRAARPLIRSLDDEDYAVRLAAAEALGNLGTLAGDAVAPLRRRGAPRAFVEAARRIERALRGEPHELMAADPLRGTGTEPEAAEAPPGTGTELEAAEPALPPREHA